MFPVWNRKSEHHHWILHIRISLGTKFQLKLIVLTFFSPNLFKREFPVENGKIALVRASMVATYYIKLFRIGADRHNGILISLLLLVAETTSYIWKYWKVCKNDTKWLLDMIWSYTCIFHKTSFIILSLSNNFYNKQLHQNKSILRNIETR